MSIADVEEYRYKASCEAADKYLTSLNIHFIGEVCEYTRLMLARALPEILVELECDTQGNFRTARIYLLELLGNALSGMPILVDEVPNHQDLAQVLRLMGCHDERVRTAFNTILAKLDSGHA